MATWYYEEKDGQQGPVGEDEVSELLQNRTIDGTCRIWSDGMADWVEVQHSPLKGLIPSGPPPLTPAGPPPLKPSGPPPLSQANKMSPAGGSQANKASAQEECPVKGWCWAAALWGWVWQLKHGGITVEGFIPLALGSTGYRIAWKSRAWTSVEEFLTAQRRWVKMWFVSTLASFFIFLPVAACSAILIECDRCNGKGTVPCVICRGSGVVRNYYGNQQCASCKGFGAFYCPKCAGSGK